MQRVLIIGAPGSGKTTLARKLGKITGLPVFQTDTMMFHDGRERRASEDVLELATDTAAGERWIIEGIYVNGLEHRVGRADHVIFLSPPVLVRMKRIVSRWSGNYRHHLRVLHVSRKELFRRLYGMLRMTAIRFPSNAIPTIVETLSKASDSTKVYEIKTSVELEKLYSEAQYYAEFLHEEGEPLR